MYVLLGNRKNGFRKFDHRKYCHWRNGHRKKVAAPAQEGDEIQVIEASILLKGGEEGQGKGQSQSPTQEEDAIQVIEASSSKK
jgi:hypothetical protein